MKINSDLLLSITTICISVLALFISISTNRKQNKIAIFEKKMECYNSIRLFFDGKKICLTAEVKLLTGNVKFNNGFKGDQEYLFSNIRLLFDDMIWKLFSKVNDLLRLIHNVDQLMSDYLSLLGEIENGNEIKAKIKEYVEIESSGFEISNEEEKSFKKLCDENILCKNDAIDGVIKLNYYDLRLLQKETYQAIVPIEKSLVEKIEAEIRISK